MAQKWGSGHSTGLASREHGATVPKAWLCGSCRVVMELEPQQLVLQKLLRKLLLAMLWEAIKISSFS